MGSRPPQRPRFMCIPPAVGCHATRNRAAILLAASNAGGSEQALSVVPAALAGRRRLLSPPPVSAVIQGSGVVSATLYIGCV